MSDLRKLLNKIDTLQSNGVTEQKPVSVKRQLNEFKSHQITDEGLGDVAAKLGTKAYQGLEKFGGKISDFFKGGTRQITKSPEEIRKLSKADELAAKQRNIKLDVEKAKKELEVANKTKDPQKIKDAEKNFKDAEKKAIPYKNTTRTTGEKVKDAATSVGKATLGGSVLGGTAYGIKKAADAMSSDTQADSSAATPAAQADTPNKPGVGGGKQQSKTDKADAQAEKYPAAVDTIQYAPGPTSTTSSKTDKTSDATGPSAADIEAARIAAEKNASEVAARSAKQQADLAAQLQASRDAAARGTEVAGPVATTQTQQGKEVQSGTPGVTWDTGTGGKLRTRSDDEIAATGPFGIKKPTAADREQGEKNLQAIKNFLGINKPVVTATQPENTTYSSTGYNPEGGRVGMPDVQYVKEGQEMNEQTQDTMENMDTINSLIRIAELSGQPITEAKMKELKGKVHKGSYGTEYQGDEDEDEDEDKKKDKTKKSKSKDDDEKKGRGRPRKDQDVKQSGDKKFGGADDAFALIAGGKSKGKESKSKETEKLDKKKNTLKEYIDEIAAEKRMIAENATLVQELDSAMSELRSVISEKAVSKQQQKFMGMVYAAKKGEKPASKEVAKAAKSMSKKAAKDFASTKHKGLPKKVDESLDIAGSDKMSNDERDAAIKKKYPNAKKVGKTPGGYSTTGKGKADLVSGIKGVRKLEKEKTKSKEKTKAKQIKESMMHLLEEDNDSLEHIVKRYKHEVKRFINGDDLDNDLFDALYDYYAQSGEMPYGVQKARDGDPYQWVSDRFYSDVVEDPLEDVLRPNNDFDDKPMEDMGIGQPALGEVKKPW